ncbi:MAG TPA: hypothetical protein VJS37_07805 [Terriglobales bacterium]|nr:hypothetical protein [Terriglobales bacterium]
MKEHCLSIVLLLGTTCYADGQAYTSKGVIRYAKALDVANLDSSLSRQPLDGWLRSGSLHLDTVQWVVSDCDLKPPDDDLPRDWPLCAKFWFRRKTHDAGGWGLVQVGTTKKGITGSPQLRILVVTQEGKFSNSQKLSDLPRLIDEASASFHKGE